MYKITKENWFSLKQKPINRKKTKKTTTTKRQENPVKGYLYRIKGVSL